MKFSMRFLRIGLVSLSFIYETKLVYLNASSQSQNKSCLPLTNVGKTLTLSNSFVYEPSQFCYGKSLCWLINFGQSLCVGLQFSKFVLRKCRRTPLLIIIHSSLKYVYAKLQKTFPTQQGKVNPMLAI